MGQSSLLMMMLCGTVVLLYGLGQFVIGSEDGSDNVLRTKLGGVRGSRNGWNSAEIESIARFAVEEHNRRENSFVELARVLEATEQVVAGKLYRLTLEVIEAGSKKIYKAKVWVKPWMNFKQLQEFKHIIDEIRSFTSSDLGMKPEGNGFDWRTVPTNDSEVQEAAKHAVKSIQQRSNSMYPYKLLDIIQARTKIFKDSIKFELVLKLQRGGKLEKFMVEVMKHQNGSFF